MRRRRLAPLLAVSVTATLAPAVGASTATAAPTGTPTTVSSSATAGGLDPYVTQKPQWKRCEAEGPAEFECATIKVPLDYRVPGGKRIDLAISRIRSTAPDKRHGVLVTNPGGPGVPGLFVPLAMQNMLLPKSVQQKYDLIGFDPRGVGKSSPVSCDLDPEEQSWPRPYKKETFDKDVAWARGVANKCKEKAGDMLPHLTTRNVARDLDVLRAVLGEKKISYLGVSYGTYLGAVYTQLFPAGADRFVLDSAVDPVRAWRGMIQWWAEGAEPAFHRWSAWAAERSQTYGLGDTPQQVERAFWDLVAQADNKPIEVDGKPITGDDIRSVMRFEVFKPKGATEKFIELKKAAAGKPASGKKLAALSGSEGTGAAMVAAEAPSDNATASFWAVACGDNSAAWSHDPESYRRDATRDKGRYPLYGDFASNITPCAFWDQSLEPATKMNNKVGSLIVQNQWDPQTPLPSGQALHAALRGSKMITVLGGEGHGAYGNANPCTEDTINNYLLTGNLPAKDVTCKVTTDSNSQPPKRQKRNVLPGSPLPDPAPNHF